jgi:beta-lactamase superfamily II metal-dependent hydrolase
VLRGLLRALAIACSAVLLGVAPARTLDVYFIDVEGGQATLIVTPRGESLLVDTGFPGGDGTFSSTPGDPAHARDANRILAAARAAGVARIDVLLITHFHADHDGGVTNSRSCCRSGRSSITTGLARQWRASRDHWPRSVGTKRCARGAVTSPSRRASTSRSGEWTVSS